MLAMAVPGTVLGIGYIRRLFRRPVRNRDPSGAVRNRRDPDYRVHRKKFAHRYQKRGISALRQIDKSIEESAYDMGADSFKVFMTVTLPLIKDSFLSGFVTSLCSQYHRNQCDYPSGNAFISAYHSTDQ